MLEYIRGDNINKMHQSHSNYYIVQNVDSRLSSFDFANVVAISEKGTAIIAGVATSASETAAAVSSPSHTCMLLNLIAACLQCIPTPTQTPELQFHVRLLFLLLLLLYLEEKNEAVDVAVVKLTEKHDKNMKQQ